MAYSNSVRKPFLKEKIADGSVRSENALSVAEQHPFQPPSTTPPQPQGMIARARRWLFEAKPQFSVGTLRYTGFGLIMVFVWLLWGDFCFTLLDQNIPNLLPLKLKDIGASDTMNSVLNGTLSYTVTFFLAPMVSMQSDRTRTRFGRRIPYLFWSTPFVGLFLVLIGCYDSVTKWIFGDATHASVLGISAPVVVLGILLVGWDLANIFVNTIYYYLFNDVVPLKYMSRFFAMFRIVISLAGMMFSKWVYPH